MSRAGTVKSAGARATIAERLIRTARPRVEGGYGLARSFDDCFEMGDGGEVKRLLVERAAKDASLRAAMRRHLGQTDAWAAEAEAAAERLLCSRCHGERREWPYTLPSGQVSDTCRRCNGSGAVYSDGSPAPKQPPVKAAGVNHPISTRMNHP